MALHALKDVVVQSLVVGLGWDFPTKERRLKKTQKKQGHQTADKHFKTSRVRNDVVPAWFLNHKQETKAKDNSETLMHSV